MTVEQLGAVAGVLLSLAFSYVPGLSDRYSVLTAVQKSLIMLGLLAVVAVGALALSCANLIQAVECTQAGVMALINTFIAAAVANQAAYRLSPHKQAAK